MRPRTLPDSNLLWSLMAMACLSTHGTDAADIQIEGFEDATSFGRWTFSNGPEFPGAKGALTRERDAAHGGDFGATLAFDFTGGGNYVQATVPLSVDEAPTHVRLWIRKPTDHRLTVRATDSTGQTFQKGFSYNYPGWQEVLVSLVGWTGHWGGKNDGVFRGAPRQFGLLVENTSEQKTGAVQLDDVRAVTGGEQPQGLAITEYLACDFATDGHFRTSTVSFDFSGSSTSTGIGADFSLMGRPQSLSVKLRSTVAGHKLQMRIGSHFQSFSRVLGELKEGDQTFEAELGNLATWEHGGGENDGVARMPLRVNVLSVEKGDGPAKGEVEFLELRCRTQVSADRAVVMIPSGRHEDDGARFECSLQSLLPTPTEGVLDCVVRDWAGNVVDRQQRPIRLSPGGRASAGIRVASDLPFLECEFRCCTDSRAYGPMAATVVASADDEGDASLRPESPFGMGLYLYRYPGNADGFARMDRAAAMAQAASVKWSREEFQWHRIEPEKGTFDFTYYDRLVETAHKHGISVYGLIAYWSRWAKAYTPEGIEDYANYCRALVSRYKDRVKHWEVWNEPNIFFWSGPRELYCDLLKAAYRAIKEADPEAQVLGCSTAGIDRGFIEMVMDSGAPFDILTIHPYRGRLDDAAFIRELQDTSKLTAKADGESKPVWITEMGWPTQLHGGVSEREQASLLARSYLCAVASGAAPNVSWYDFREDGNNPFYNEHHFGVVRNNDMSPKPGYRALATVCRTLAGQTVQEELDFGKGVLAFRFAGRGYETIAVWSPTDAVVLGLELKGALPAVRDLMGTPVSLPEIGGTHLLALRPGCPVFLTGDRVEVVRASRPIELSVPAGAHPGEAITVAGRVSVPFAGVEVTPDVPTGWGGDRAATNAEPAFSFSLSPPATAPPGNHDVTLVLSLGNGSLRLPLAVTIVPALLRV